MPNPLSNAWAVGFAKEVTPGTPVTAAFWVPIKNRTIKKLPNVILPEVAAQNPSPYRYAVQGIEKIAGDLVYPLFVDAGQALIFGAIGSDTKTGTGPYTHTGVLRTTGVLPSWTIEENINGANFDHQWSGMMASKINIKAALNAEAICTVTMEGMKDLVLGAAGTPSWPTDAPISPTQLSFSVGAVIDTNVQALDITIDNAAKPYPGFNSQTYPVLVAATTRKVTVKMTTLLQALNGGGNAQGYFADILTPVLRALGFTVTQGANTITLTLPAAVITGYDEKMKIGDLVMVDVEFTGAIGGGSSVDLQYVVVNNNAVAY